MFTISFIFPLLLAICTLMIFFIVMDKPIEILISLVLLIIFITLIMAFNSFQNEKKLKVYQKYCKEHNLILIQKPILCKQNDDKYIIVTSETSELQKGK